MVTVIKADINNIKDIQTVAKTAWPAAFEELLSKSQIEYMMEMMYSDKSLREQMEKGHHFYLVKQKERFVGYMSIEHNCENSRRTKIHKIYVLPDLQKLGIGKTLLTTAVVEAKKRNEKAVYLNVNKYNSRAIGFYLRNGFERIKEEIIDIGNGFVMDDYVYEKSLN